MKSLIRKLIRSFIYRVFRDKDENNVTSYQLAKNWYRYRLSLRREFFNSLLIISGILTAGFGLESFLLPNKFIDGGATGIALLTSGLTGVSLSVLLLIINIPFIFMGYKVMGKQFALKTALAIAGLAVCVAVVPYPHVTHDKLLVSVFGGFFLGAGIGLSVRGGAVIDGTEVLAVFLSRKLSITIGDVILIVNIVIFSVAAWLLSVETALYSLLTYLAASKTVDFFIEGIEEYIAVTIISAKSEEIREMIVNRLGRGVTIFKGKRGFIKNVNSPTDVDIIYSVITRLEISKLNAEVEKIDKNAFVVMNSIKDTKGGMVKKRPLHG